MKKPCKACEESKMRNAQAERIVKLENAIRDIFDLYDRGHDCGHAILAAHNIVKSRENK